MRRSRDSLIWGIVLLIVGLGFLLWNFDVFSEFQDVAQIALAAFFALVGLGFLVSYLITRGDWWKVIPGFALLAVAGIIFLGSREAPAEWIGVILFAGLALSFAVIYFSDRQERWWALIPFGAMVVMSAAVLLGSLGWDERALGAVLFGGMGLVFLFVYLLSEDRSQFRWALIPTSVLLVMGLVSLTSAIAAANPALAQMVELWPVLLVIAGVFLLGLYISRPAPREAPTQLPPQPPPAEQPAAPGTSVLDVPDEIAESPATSRVAPQRIERAPVVLVASGVPAPSVQASGENAGAGSSRSDGSAGSDADDRQAVDPNQEPG